MLIVVRIGQVFPASSNYFVGPLANLAALAYYSPPRNTTRHLQGRRSKGCGVDREVGAAKFAALTAAKKIAAN
ncbi:hypothetical protein, partial [Cupriavidus taiwanensis]|uniref:hypothetical protein n=1 Tax=Cupriavidus taiwanensis TaxID=164546 RepID=UPI0039C0F224